MSGDVSAKWRPPLLLVLGGSLLAVLVLPILGAVVVDAIAPDLGRQRAVMIVALGALSATVILGWLLWRLILAPVRALAEKAEAVRDGAPVTPLDRYGTPEISDLGRVVLDMARVLQTREMAVRSYADHMTHELKTPLSAIRGAAELLAEEDLGADAQNLIATIVSAERRSEHLLSAIRQIASAREPTHHGKTTLADIAPRLSRPEGLEIVTRGQDVILPLSDEGLSIVLNHLIENAGEAGASKLQVRAEDPHAPRLIISDNGRGISPGNQARIFEPFFTTGRESGGTGMGLAIVQTMLLAHGGQIMLAPDSPETTFEIRF